MTQITQADAERLKTECRYDKDAKRWVCRFCSLPHKIYYVTTGHDHTDWSINFCDCRAGKQRAVSEDKHTLGPWHVGGDGTIIFAPDGFAVANATVFHRMHGARESVLNAHRIVACVNACDGFSIEELDGAHLHRDSIEAQNENERLTLELVQAQSDRQREHDLRVKFAGEKETLTAALTGSAKPSPSDEGSQVLHAVFQVCEATEDIDPENDFQRGRVFEAKKIRNAVGNWFQEEFCGRTFMGEPAPAALKGGE